ncbi:hypothetical protein ANOM_007253 [Aspergillus nomiae NRRL 13137]|uniref:DUF7730 domain-containing protein n=1 Tax=Aspergillus nomiae NRRL (strain ATCC 15546 / NRRL 13137 / CBS 260.88 / M93) TaxID=1509407 RepID=A0A0L1IXT4_ASPN3|nr:uncharacterized protein ANOM_007253 [Aspergillus nomiae NRRL 13137]KNG84314.1 hypothetical protein ANOM_007253 [Aspergillus nomiae NRRL 13137]
MRNKLTHPNVKFRRKALSKILKLFRQAPKHERTAFPSLLDLPSEIRLLIYQFAFATTGNHILVTVDRDRRESRPMPTTDDPNERPTRELRYTRMPSTPLPAALLQTNQQIYCEALPVLYANTIFSASSNLTSLMYLKDRLSQFARNNIRQVQLCPTSLLSESFIRERELLSWTILCAEVADLPGLGRVWISYPKPETLKYGTIEFHRGRYAKWLDLVRAKKCLVFDVFEGSAEDREKCRKRFREIVRDTGDALGD